MYYPISVHDKSFDFYLFVGQPESREIFEHYIVLVVVRKAFLIFHTIRTLHLLQRSFLRLFGLYGRIVGR